MRTKNAKVTARILRWRKFLGENGCAITGDQPEIHHMFGAAKKAKIGLFSQPIGEIACIPLSYYWHRDYSNPSNVDLYPKRFEAAVGRTQKEIFHELALQFAEFEPDEIEAVMRY